MPALSMRRRMQLSKLLQAQMIPHMMQNKWFVCSHGLVIVMTSPSQVSPCSAFEVDKMRIVFVRTLSIGFFNVLKRFCKLNI